MSHTSRSAARPGSTSRALATLLAIAVVTTIWLFRRLIMPELMLASIAGVALGLLLLLVGRSTRDDRRMRLGWTVVLGSGAAYLVGLEVIL